MSKTGLTEKDDGDNGQGLSVSPSLEKDAGTMGSQDVEGGTARGKGKLSVTGRIRR